MLGIEDYGSDVESGDEGSSTTLKMTPAVSSSSLLSTSKSTFTLPPPKSSSAEPQSTNSTAPSKPKRTKKIAINLPSLPPPEGEDEDDGPPLKKPRIAASTGAGKSSLLSMLPAPKQPNPVIEKKDERVLGGGGGPGLVFRASKSDAELEGPTDVSAPSTAFLPPSLKKGRTNISIESSSTAPATNFFSLGSYASPTPTPAPSSSATTLTSAPSSSSSVVISSAPAISTFRPPSPTLDDPYPGYYQLPSGAYVPYDAAYYASYAKKWKSDYDAHIRALEKAQYDPETGDAQDVDMAAEMEKARREIKVREDRKALTTGKASQGEDGEPAMPRMNVKGAKLGAVARSRHQLTTLLTEAYLNRDALEEKIAQGRRNRKEAGMKYGF